MKDKPIYINSYIGDDGSDVEIYKYKGVVIRYNAYGEWEYTICANWNPYEDYWYKSLDDAIEAIDKRGNVYDVVQDVDNNNDVCLGI